MQPETLTSRRSSSRHAEVDKVTAALEIARKRRPDLTLDGEMQADTAIQGSVVRQMYPSTAWDRLPMC